MYPEESEALEHARGNVWSHNYYAVVAYKPGTCKYIVPYSLKTLQ